MGMGPIYTHTHTDTMNWLFGRVVPKCLGLYKFTQTVGKNAIIENFFDGIDFWWRFRLTSIHPVTSTANNRIFTFSLLLLLLPLQENRRLLNKTLHCKLSNQSCVFNSITQPIQELLSNMSILIASVRFHPPPPRIVVVTWPSIMLMTQ